MNKNLKKLKRNNFLEIEARWYAKLKESGFNDIEDTKHDLRPLKSWHSLRWLKTDPDSIRAKFNYYTNANHFLAIYQFENNEHKLIWMLHCEGLSIREIEKQLSLSRSSIHKIIIELKTLMEEHNESEF